MNYTLANKQHRLLEKHKQPFYTYFFFVINSQLIKALGIDNPEEEHQWSVPEKQVEFFVLPIKLNYKNSYCRTSLLVNEANTKILKYGDFIKFIVHVVLCTYCIALVK